MYTQTREERREKREVSAEKGVGRRELRAVRAAHAKSPKIAVGAGAFYFQGGGGGIRDIEIPGSRPLLGYRLLHGIGQCLRLSIAFRTESMASLLLLGGSRPRTVRMDFVSLKITSASSRRRTSGRFFLPSSGAEALTVGVSVGLDGSSTDVHSEGSPSSQAGKQTGAVSGRPCIFL